MRICLVTETYWPDINGVAMTLHRVFRALREIGHDIQLICPANIERHGTDLTHVSTYLEAPSFAAPGYAEVKLGMPINKRLAALWKREKPDVVYVATEGPLGYFAARLARKLKLPVASGFHTNFQSYSGHYGLGMVGPLIEKYLVHMHNMTQRTIVPTSEQQGILETMGIRNVAVVGRGVDTDLFNPNRRTERLRRDWQARPEDPVMIYVGRIAEEKNLDLMLTAYQNLKQQSPGLKFVMVGGGPASERVRRQHPDIILTGPRTGATLAEHYASADFFVFSSLTETYGNVILEAMASGIGILAYNYAAGKIHIEHGVNGLIAAPGNQAEFLAAAHQLIERPEQLTLMRRNATKHAKQFNWAAIARGFESALCSIQKNPKSRRPVITPRQNRFA